MNYIWLLATSDTTIGCWTSAQAALDYLNKKYGCKYTIEKDFFDGADGYVGHHNDWSIIQMPVLDHLASIDAEPVKIYI